SFRNHDLYRNSMALGYLSTASARRHSCITIQCESDLTHGGSCATSRPHFSRNSPADTYNHPRFSATPFSFFSWVIRFGIFIANRKPGGVDLYHPLVIAGPGLR